MKALREKTEVPGRGRNSNYSASSLQHQLAGTSRLLTCAVNLRFASPPNCMRASLVAQLVKNPPVIWETWVRTLGWEDPLEGNSYVLQDSGLENSMDCIIHGVTKNQTWLSDFHFHNSMSWVLKIKFSIPHALSVCLTPPSLSSVSLENSKTG